MCKLNLYSILVAYEVDDEEEEEEDDGNNDGGDEGIEKGKV